MNENIPIILSTSIDINELPRSHAVLSPERIEAMENKF